MAQTRHVTQQQGLARRGIGSGNHRLRGNHCSDARYHHHRQSRPGGEEPEKWILNSRRIELQQGALAEIVEDQGGQHQKIPGHADGSHTKMTHVGVERLRPGDGEDYSAQDHQATDAVYSEKMQGVPRVERKQYLRISADPGQSGAEKSRNHTSMLGPKR